MLARQFLHIAHNFGAPTRESNWKQQDRDHSGRTPDQRIQEHPQDLPALPTAPQMRPPGKRKSFVMGCYRL